MNNITATREDPPRAGQGHPGNADWFSLASRFRQYPGEWFKLSGTWAASQAFNIRAGKLKAFPEGEYEATCRKAEDGRTYVWVRFIGGDQ